MINILGINGKAGHGKDTVADMILKMYRNREVLNSPVLSLGYTGKPLQKYSLATPIKTISEYVFDMTDQEMNTQEGKREVARYGYGKTNRELLQLIGTEMFRDIIHSDIWLDVAERKISDTVREGGLVVVPDIRFDNEAGWLKKRGVLIQVVRPDIEDITENAHASEAGITVEPDYVIVNDGDKDDLEDKVENLFKELFPEE